MRDREHSNPHPPRPGVQVEAHRHRRISDLPAWAYPSPSSSIGGGGEGGLLNVVVEIPAGQTAKIEYDPACHKWQMDRVVDYLAYPCNYGFVPSTLAGDGDPLDVLLLGNAVGSGSVVHARPVAVMRMVDGGLPDDKIIAVPPHGMSPMGDVVDDLADLEREYAGVTDVLRVWFSNYKRKPGHVQILGFEGAEAAVASIEEAVTE